jgi:tagaturonate reductase
MAADRPTPPPSPWLPAGRPPDEREPSAAQRVIQFGTGRFLRGFVDAFLYEEARAGTGDGRGHRVTAVETSGSGSARRLRAQGCRYRLLVRGLLDGHVVDQRHSIDVIDQALDASHERDAMVEAGLHGASTAVVSNTTEAGYAPGRFPALLSLLLEARARAALPGLVILPCELVEDNARRLRELVLADARQRGVEAAHLEHMDGANIWAVTIVDRIATAPAPDDPAGEGDPFAVVVEPYASWVVEVPLDVGLPVHPAIERTDDVRPTALRKIRILNGAHSALATRTRGRGFALVREALDDEDVASWLEDLLLEEVVPALGERIADGVGFSRTVLERFRNPFQDHRLADIAEGHAGKLLVRLLPTYHDYVARFGRRPRRLAALLASEGLVA